VLNIKEQLEQVAYNELVDIDNYEISFTKSFIVERPSGYYIAIDRNQIESDSEEAALLAHELGHYFTGYLYNRNSPLQTKERCEYRANAWAIKALCPLGRIIQAIRNGCIMTQEIAEELSLPEDMIIQAISLYQRKGLLSCT